MNEGEVGAETLTSRAKLKTWHLHKAKDSGRTKACGSSKREDGYNMSHCCKLLNVPGHHEASPQGSHNSALQ